MVYEPNFTPSGVEHWGQRDFPRQNYGVHQLHLVEILFLALRWKIKLKVLLFEDNVVLYCVLNLFKMSYPRIICKKIMPFHQPRIEIRMPPNQTIRFSLSLSPLSLSFLSLTRRMNLSLMMSRSWSQERNGGSPIIMQSII